MKSTRVETPIALWHRLMFLKRYIDMLPICRMMGKNYVEILCFNIKYVDETTPNYPLSHPLWHNMMLFKRYIDILPICGMMDIFFSCSVMFQRYICCPFVGWSHFRVTTIPSLFDISWCHLSVTITTLAMCPNTMMRVTLVLGIIGFIMLLVSC